jgi:hypothetical protein
MWIPLVALVISPQKSLTFYQEVAPIIYRSCTPCHRPGESAPFSLTNLKEVQKHAESIEIAVSNRFMPPWKAKSDYAQYKNPRSLTEKEIDTIRKWVRGGKLPGDPSKASPTPQFQKGWQLGQPDLVLEMPTDFEIPAEGPDILQNFVIPTELPKDRTVEAIELRPGNPKVVHHALVFLDENGAAKKLDQATKEPGYSSFGGPGFFPTGSLGGWAPGGTPHTLPDGIGRYFKKGSDVVLQLHYHPTGKIEKDRSSIGVYFSKKPVQRLVGGFALENWEINIPAGNKQYIRKSSYRLPKQVTLLTVTPHMHLLGKEMKADATLPDGKAIPLVWVQNWDFRWQDTFVFKQPIELPAGTVINMSSVHDNSEDNSVNPFSPPRTIEYGEGSNDEMSLCIFEFTSWSIKDLLEVIADDGKHRKVLERAISLTQKGKRGI